MICQEPEIADCRFAQWHSVERLWLLYLSFTLLLIRCSFAQGQTPPREQLIGTWIGVHSELSTDLVCPLPTYIQLDADSIYHLGLVDGSTSELKSTWSVTGENVRLDTIHYASRLLSVKDNLLRIGTNYPMVFRRFTDISIDSASAYQQLSGHVWQSDNLTIYLYTNGQVRLENTITNQRTAHFWQLAQFGQSVFLIIRGNQYNHNGGYKPLWQISTVSSKLMQAIGWNGCRVASETFRLVRDLSPDDLHQPTDFQTCDNCFQPIWHEVPLSHSPRRYDINQLFRKQYQPVSQSGQSGLIRIQFVVNCEGEQGLVDLHGFGEDYCPKIFDCRITDQLQTICRDYVAADPSLRMPEKTDARLQDVSVSLTFRLKDGLLTDILP
ncbi:hypothetical protein [Spirosoma flavum]|uniref:TonB C-terminal domain-containing protein n=1 Tax=Spirosoma flavum TaxID=2048557 RepID=A0ABW6AFH4_9BACT